jgi:hypothetical protein
MHYGRLIVCTRPWRRVFYVVVTRHVLGNNRHGISRILGQQQCSCQAGNARAATYSAQTHAAGYLTNPTTTMLAMTVAPGRCQDAAIRDGKFLVGPNQMSTSPEYRKSEPLYAVVLEVEKKTRLLQSRHGR